MRHFGQYFACTPKSSGPGACITPFSVAFRSHEIFQTSQPSVWTKVLEALLLALLDGHDLYRDDGTLLEKGSDAFLHISSTFFAFILLHVLLAGQGRNLSFTAGDIINRLKTLLGLRSERERNPSLTMGNFINRLKTLLGLGDETAPDQALVELFLGEGFPDAGAFLTLDKLLPAMQDKKSFAVFFDHFQIQALENMRPGSIFFTTKGRIGLGPDNATSGDVVAIVAGCKRPVILRKAGDHFTFVSTCYLAGFMDGEVKYVVEEYGLTEIEVH
jgi:hypothetical protein